LPFSAITGTLKTARAMPFPYNIGENIPADAGNIVTDSIQNTPTVQLRPFASLGKADHGWLNANHHFSFASYHNAARMNWGAMRVWNDDEIAAQKGFAPHAHDNMEIITYVRQGAITHRDSMGNEGRTEAGDVQVMSAGTGVTHSEFNLDDSLCRLFQIWILPRDHGIAPRWEQRQFPQSNRAGSFTVLASGYGEQDALFINADARVLGATAQAGDVLHYAIEPGHHAYLVPAKGDIRVNNVVAQPRDGVAIAGQGMLIIEVLSDAELVMVDSV
jgi:quercetin 2,3-dioxygenase